MTLHVSAVACARFNLSLIGYGYNAGEIPFPIGCLGCLTTTVVLS